MPIDLAHTFSSYLLWHAFSDRWPEAADADEVLAKAITPQDREWLEAWKERLAVIESEEAHEARDDHKVRFRITHQRDPDEVTTLHDFFQVDWFPREEMEEVRKGLRENGVHPWHSGCVFKRIDG